MNKRIIIPVLILLVQSFATGKIMAQTTVTAKVDAKQISVGDPMQYFITANVDTTKSQLRWPVLQDTFNTLEITEKGKIDTSRNGASVTYKQRLLITGFDSGSFAIPSFAFLAINKNGTVDSVFTDSFRLLVNTVPVDTAKPFKGIKGVAGVETSWMDNLPMILAIVLGIGLVILLTVIVMRKRKRKPENIQPEKIETFHERTLRLLAELDEKQLWQHDRPKEYYTELSEIIRHYIEMRFQTNAMELTTDELLKKAKKHREMAAFSKLLRPLLESADLAKFAKANPLPEEHIEALDLAIGFVKTTKPKEQTIATNTTTIQSRKK